MIAVISDIHANYGALEAVLEEIERLGADTIICLGDIVGYGPQPVACVDAARSRFSVTLCGNHDFALIRGAEDFNPIARSSIEYHRRLIMPRPEGDNGDGQRRERWDFLKGLPYRHVRDELLFVHGSPRNPVVEYLRRIDAMLGFNDKIADNFRQIDWLCFVGHTHQAGIITREMRFLDPQDVDGAYRPKPHEKAIINVGSVGQPRDRDQRAAFVTIGQDYVVRFRRVRYDVEAVAARILATPGIDHSLAARLRQGR